MLEPSHPMVIVLMHKAMPTEKGKNKHLKNITSEAGGHFIILLIMNTSGRYHD